jgi:hypothetical protein
VWQANEAKPASVKLRIIVILQSPEMLWNADYD